MINDPETSKQAAFQWLIGELLRDGSQTGTFELARDFIESASGFDREVLLGTLFWYALDHGEWPLAEHCVEAGFALAADQEDLSDAGAVFDAVQSLGDRPDVIRWLVEHGAEIERRDGLGCTPLMAAAAYGHEKTVALLLEYGADPNAHTEVDGSYTALIAAAQHGYEPIVKMLLTHGADVRRWGDLAADAAQAAGHEEIADVIRTNRRRR